MNLEIDDSPGEQESVSSSFPDAQVAFALVLAAFSRGRDPPRETGQAGVSTSRPAGRAPRATTQGALSASLYLDLDSVQHKVFSAPKCRYCLRVENDGVSNDWREPVRRAPGVCPAPASAGGVPRAFLPPGPAPPRGL